MTTIEAKRRLTIFDLWQVLGLPGRAAPSCSSPFRDDKHPSFSIYRQGTRFYDHGPGIGGDAIDFVRYALNVQPNEATREFIRLAAGHPGAGAFLRRTNVCPEGDSTLSCPKTLRIPSAIGPGGKEDWKKLSRLRNVSEPAIWFAVRRGWLRFATMSDQTPDKKAWHKLPAWLLVSPFNAQARRLDGKTWRCCGDKKSRSIKNSLGSWPIGLEDLDVFDRVAFVEGEGDALAALHFALKEWRQETGVITMAGGSKEIHPEVLPRFNGKRVRIFPHCDDTGLKAVQKWSSQLRNAGAEVDILRLDGLMINDGTPVSDLNDLTQLSDSCREANPELLELFKL